MALLQPAPDAINDLVTELVNEYHPELAENNVRIDVLMALPDLDKDGEPKDRPAVTHNGYPALAKVRICPPRDRAKGYGDAEITIDDAQFMLMEPDERKALIDHELYHIQVKHKDDDVVLDKYGRPALKLRKHDHEYGWFDAIAERWQQNSQEWQQARRFQGSNSGRWILDAIQSPLDFGPEDQEAA